MLAGRYRALVAALTQADIAPDIHFAVKAQDSIAILRLLGELGAGADIVSGGELARCLKAGIEPAKIIFSGVGKTGQEIADALRAGIRQINAESVEEVRAISRIARDLGAIAPVALRINPDIAAGGHEKISTGRKDDKFGIAWNQAKPLYISIARNKLPNIHAAGLACHVGSQILDYREFAPAYEKLRDCALELIGKNIRVPQLDCGGGLGVPYADEAPLDLQAWAGMAAHIFAPLREFGISLAFEPGRYIAAPAGILLSQVVRVKRIPTPQGERQIAILNAGMNDLARPGLYGATHLPLAAMGGAAGSRRPMPTTLAGPVCESTDTFSSGIPLPPLEAGDKIAFLDAGAYGNTMSSTYNSRPLAAHYLIEDGRLRLIAKPQDIHALLERETIP